jgi:hypothetical protein
MKFRNLPVGSIFNFANHQIGMANGPWVKTGNRKYIKLGELQDITYTVGSINTEVDAVEVPPKDMTRAFIKRPEGGNNFPLIEHFVFTGEAINPWRCFSCQTAAQRNSAGGASVTLLDVPQDLHPQCCRKCGVSFNR